MSEIRVDLITEKTADGGVTIKSTGTGDNKPTLLTLQTSEADIAANDVLGKIQFQAPDEGTGTDAILVSAAIQARSEGDFAADANATAIDFMVGASEAAATKMTLSSAGKLDVSGGIDIEGGAVFNEDSADVDFRVESNGDANMLFVDGGNNRVGVGTGTPSSALEIVGASSVPQLTVRSNNATAANNAGLLLYNTDSATAASRKVELVLDADGANASGTDYLLIKKEGNNGDATIHQQNNASLIIKTKGTMILSSDDTERVRIHDSGGVMSVVNGIALGVGTANTASNVLDDYEEGTWTPTFTSGGNTLSFSGGGETYAYTKVGNVCTVTFNIANCTTSGTAATGDNRITLPFTGKGGVRQPTSIISYFSSGGLRYTGADVLMGEVGSSTAFIQLQEWINSTGYRNISVAPTTGGGTYFWFSLTYLTA